MSVRRRFRKNRRASFRILALRAHRSLGLKVYSRVDIILPEEDEPTVLEAQYHPGNDGGEFASRRRGGRGNQLPAIVRAHHRTFAREREPAK